MPLVVHAHRHVPDLPLVERHGRALCRAPDQMVVRRARRRVPDHAFLCSQVSFQACTFSNCGNNFLFLFLFLFLETLVVY
jgi:hypothetical protein